MIPQHHEVTRPESVMKTKRVYEDGGVHHLRGTTYLRSALTCMLQVPELLLVSDGVHFGSLFWGGGLARLERSLRR